MMFGFGPQISSNLLALLKDPDSKIDDVLNDDTCIRAFKSNYSKLTEYILERKDEVLRIAIQDTQIGLKAYQLFTPETDFLVKSLAEDDQLTEISKEVFVEDASSIVINRFAYITQLMITATKRVDFPFIEKFFAFLHLRSVYGIFETLPDETIDEVFTCGLAKDLIDYLETLKDKTTENSGNQICNIMRILHLFIEEKDNHETPDKSNDNLKTLAKSEDTMKIVMTEFANKATKVMEKQFSFAAEAVTEETYPIVEARIDELISYVDPIEGLSYQPHQVESIRLLGQLCSLSSTAREKIAAAGLDAKFVEVAKVGKTFAHLAIIFFCEKCISFPEIAAPILEAILGYAADVIMNKESITGQRAFAWELFKSVKNAEKNEVVAKEALEEIAEEAKNKFVEITEVSEKDYGGKLPDPQPASEELLSNFTPEQIMQLLRLLNAGN